MTAFQQKYTSQKQQDSFPQSEHSYKFGKEAKYHETPKSPLILISHMFPPPDKQVATVLLSLCFTVNESNSCIFFHICHFYIGLCACFNMNAICSFSLFLFIVVGSVYLFIILLRIRCLCHSQPSDLGTKHCG